MLTDYLQRWDSVSQNRRFPVFLQNCLAVVASLAAFAAGAAMLIIYKVYKVSKEMCNGFNKPTKGCTLLNDSLILQGVAFIGLGLCWFILVIVILVKTRRMNKLGY